MNLARCSFLHASLMAYGGETLCGAGGETTLPRETVNCPDCRVALNHLRHRYPEHAQYADWRLTREQERKAVEGMVADMYGGVDD